MLYQVKFFKGDYDVRQRRVNKWGSDFYVEGHGNSAKNIKAKYSTALVPHNASKKSIKCGQVFLDSLYRRAGIKKWKYGIGGVKKTNKSGKDSRGNFNMRYVASPCMLIEPVFLSNKKQAVFIKTFDGQVAVAQAVFDTILQEFPSTDPKNPVKIALSVGHKGKKSKPRDRGAPIDGGGYEADVTEPILLLLSDMLSNYRKKKVSTTVKTGIELKSGVDVVGKAVKPKYTSLLIPNEIVNEIRTICDKFKKPNKKR